MRALRHVRGCVAGEERRYRQDAYDEVDWQIWSDLEIIGVRLILRSSLDVGVIGPHEFYPHENEPGCVYTTSRGALGVYTPTPPW